MVLEFFQDASYDKKIFFCYQIFWTIGGAALESKIRLRHAHVRLQDFHFEKCKSARIGFRPF